MKLDKLFQTLLLTGAFAFLLVAPANAKKVQEDGKGELYTQTVDKASTNSQLREIQLPATNAQMLVQTLTTPVVQITGVKANSTEKGVEVILETTQGEQLQVTNRSVGNNFIADITGGQLQLPNGNSNFRLEKPIAGITEIVVADINGNTVQVTVAGEETLPAVELFDDNAGLIFAVASTTTKTQPEPEKPTSENSLEQSTADNDEPIELVVTATRTEEDVQNVPRSVTIIKREELEQQTGSTNNLPDLLGKLVPGLSPPTLQNSTRGLTLRGRQALILIDGIPQNPNSGFATELNTIAPGAIERIEVVRGPSAVYGDGATGGIINLITRKPGTKPLESELSFTVRNSTEKFTEEGFSYNTQYNLFAQNEGIDFTLGFAYGSNQSFFDANGSRIPPNGVNDTDALNLLLKAGFDIDPQQRLQLSYNIYKESRDSDFRSDPIIFSIPGLQTARAQKFPVTYAKKPEQTNQVASLSYSHENLFGSKLSVLGFYRSTDLTQVFSDLRGRTFPAFFPLLWQTSLDSKEYGARLQVETSFSPEASLLWGADYSNEENSRPLLISDIPTFVRTNELNASSTRPQTPFYTLKNLGLFAQLQWDILPPLRFNGGLRYDTFQYAVSDYQLAFGAPGIRFGAEDNNSGVSFNAGLVYKLTPELNVYTSFAQGFSLPDLGTAFSSVLPNVGVKGSDLVEPLKVNNYELGIRGNWGTVQAELAGFFSSSDLGSSIRVNRNGTTELERAPQRNYGIEASVDWQPTEAWGLGGSLTWNEGENNSERDPRDFIPLSSVQVPPLKAFIYLENETLPNWRNRLQLLAVGNRDRAFKDQVDSFEVEGYTTVDFLSSLKLGQSKFELGVENLLNNQYLPISSQERTGLTEERRFAGRGRTIFLRYGITF
jgi:iron complex outermembrane receptor protein